MTRPILVAGMFLLFWQSGTASDFSFKSTVNQVGLLELYTSEGCSSCPPADRWLSGLLDNESLWREIIPLAFHVDYWDYIGWKDRFASPDFSERQREYARQQSIPAVYTPGFVYNGSEWRNWFVRRMFDFPGGGRPGVLELVISDRVADIHFRPTVTSAENLEINVALLGFDLSTKVEAGENSGRDLTHNFVVLGISRLGLEQADNELSATIELPESQVTARRHAVVAWVSSTSHQAPLQAVGGWLPDDPNSIALPAE